MTWFRTSPRPHDLSGRIGSAALWECPPKCVGTIRPGFLLQRGRGMDGLLSIAILARRVLLGWVPDAMTCLRLGAISPLIPAVDVGTGLRTL